MCKNFLFGIFELRIALTDDVDLTHFRLSSMVRMKSIAYAGLNRSAFLWHLRSFVISSQNL